MYIYSIVAKLIKEIITHSLIERIPQAKCDESLMSNMQNFVWYRPFDRGEDDIYHRKVVQMTAYLGDHLK